MSPPTTYTTSTSPIRKLQDILLAIQTNSLLTDKDRMRMTDDSYYLRTAARRWQRLFTEVPESLSNTLLIAERCNVDLVFQGLPPA